ncbi:uncharacterized protein LOC133289708 [Gastrolobium bilobum]|uniref:uncharacterized protein LOC133289708 n=1 Tax=Gastrolobium bilobum TaxID=150636 RepID=UPI002AB2F9F9|nr:uncharacterized protein LOC133289708 [Gastrolobium bilobum]
MAYILARPIMLADQVAKTTDEASLFKQECVELKSKAEKLAVVLRQAARSSSCLYERLTRRIIDETEQVLYKALSLVLKCRANGLMKRLFTIIPAAAFRKMSSQLENSIGDVSWLLSISAPADDFCDDFRDEFLGLPPIAANEPILCLIWEQITILYTGSLEDRIDAAASLVSLARGSDRYGNLIIEEGGVGPLMKEGKMEGQENTARAIGLLARDPKSVEHMIHVGVLSVFAEILREGPMKVQAVVAWAVSELAAYHPECQDLFAQHNIIRLLVGHLASETVEEHSKYDIVSPKPPSIHAVVMATSNLKKENEDYDKQGHQRNYSPSGINMKGRELEDPETKTSMKEMAARALWHLAKGNSLICHSITESRALLCFAVLLERGPEAVQYNSAMAVMEITTVAENNTKLRKYAFKPNSPACKAVVDQVLRIIEKADSDLLIPCIKTIGNLARTFPTTETRMIGPLVRLLDEREASIALGKFACTENYLNLDHSKAIVSEGGAKHLVQLVYFGEQMVQIPALLLLSYIALHAPDREELAMAEVLGVLEWASKQSSMTQDETLDELLQKAKSWLEFYQSRGSRGFH